MKKLALSLITGAAIALTPLSSFALTPMSDAGLKNATGQAGVSITLDNVVIEQHIGATEYYDEDGYGGAVGDGGSIVISNKHLIKKFNAITTGSALSAAGYNYGSTAIGAVEGSGTWDKAAALSIDVGKCEILMAGNNNNKDAKVALTDTYDVSSLGLGATPLTFTQVVKGITDNAIAGGGDLDTAATSIRAAAQALGKDVSYAEARGLANFSQNAWADMDVVGVVIGLPTIEITTSEDTYDVGVKMAGAINDGQNFIKVTKGASTMAILSGVVEIAAH